MGADVFAEHDMFYNRGRFSSDWDDSQVICFMRWIQTAWCIFYLLLSWNKSSDMVTSIRHRITSPLFTQPCLSGILPAVLNHSFNTCRLPCWFKDLPDILSFSRSIFSPLSIFDGKTPQVWNTVASWGLKLCKKLMLRKWQSVPMWFQAGLRYALRES